MSESVTESEFVIRDRKWHECMLRVGRGITETFEKDNMLFTDMLISTNCMRHLMCWVYLHLVYRKKLVRIEELSKEQKESMWDVVKDICAGKTNDQKKMIEVAKCFYTIEYFLNEQK